MQKPYFNKFIFTALSVLLILLGIFVGIILYQGITVSKSFNPEITSAVGSIFGAIFGTAVSLLAVFIYNRALEQDKKLFIKKEELVFYQDLYISLNTLHYELGRKENCTVYSLYGSLAAYKDVMNPNDFPNGYTKEELDKKWKSYGDEAAQIKKDILHLKSNYHNIYQKEFQKLKCLIVRISDPEILLNMSLIRTFLEKVMMAIEDNVNIVFKENSISNFYPLVRETLQIISDKLMLENAPELQIDEFNQKLDELKLR